MTSLDSHDDVDDFLCGADLMAAGGCGDPKVASRLLPDDLDRGMTLGWSPLDLSTEGIYCTACYCGSAAPESFEAQSEADLLAHAGRDPRPLRAAGAGLADYPGLTRAG